MITLLLLVRATYIWVLFFMHILFVVNRAFSTTPAKWLQQRPLQFATNHIDCTFFLWRLSYSTTFTSWSQHHFLVIGKPKHHTVAASNNRDHMPRSLYYCLFAPHICRCYSSRTSYSWWTVHSAQHQRSGCNSTNYCYAIASPRWRYKLPLFNSSPTLVVQTDILY